MKEENYELVVFQGDTGTIDLTYEEIEAEWNKMLQTVPQIGKFRIIHQEKRGTPSKITAVRSGTPTQHLVSGSTKE